MASPGVNSSIPVVNPNSAAQVQAELAKRSAFTNFLSKITVDQGPDFDQSMAFTPAAVSSTLTSLRTDRKIKFITLTARLRLTMGAAAPVLLAGSPILGTPLFRLFNQIVVRGTHVKLGTVQIINIDGETQAELNTIYLNNYNATWDVSVGGLAAVRNGALSNAINATNDVQVVLPIPTFPLGLGQADVPLNCLHGPDWPGNLYVDVTCGDATMVSSTANNPTISSFGAAGGNGSIDVSLERPALTADLMNKIVSAVTFRLQNTAAPTAAVTAGGGANTVLANLFVGGGRNTTRIILKFGAKQTAIAPTAGLSAFASLGPDASVANTFISLDQRPQRFWRFDITFADYFARTVSRSMPVGYKVFDFIEVPGEGVANIRAAYPSSQFDASRQFSLQSNNVTPTVNGLAVVIQESIYGLGSVNL